MPISLTVLMNFGLTLEGDLEDNNFEPWFLKMKHVFMGDDMDSAFTINVATDVTSADATPLTIVAPTPLPTGRTPGSLRSGRNRRTATQEPEQERPPQTKLANVLHEEKSMQCADVTS